MFHRFLSWSAGAIEATASSAMTSMGQGRREVNDS
jgi:hypothetical protein